MKEEAEPLDEGRWCQCCTSLRLYGRINAIYYLRLIETDWWELRRSSRAVSAGDNTSTCQEPIAWTELCGKGRGAPGGCQVEQEAALCPSSKKLLHFLPCIRRNITRRWREVALPLYSALERSHLSAVSVSVLLSTRETWSYWRESREVTQRWWRHWSISHMKKG